MHDQDTLSGVELRPATTADIPALSALGCASFIAKFGYLYDAEDLRTFLSQTHSEAAVARELANPRRLYRLAEQDGKLVGYCKLGLECSFPQHARGRRVLELKQLYTAPAATGKGIGAALMDWALAELAQRGADEVQLSVWSGNRGAHRFYGRYGFEKVADVTFPVGKQIDEEFLMARRI